MGLRRHFRKLIGLGSTALDFVPGGGVIKKGIKTAKTGFDFARASTKKREKPKIDQNKEAAGGLKVSTAGINQIGGNNRNVIILGLGGVLLLFLLAKKR